MSRSVFAIAVTGAVAITNLLLWAAIAQLPCPTEDSTNCTWDAAVQGDKKGQSFTSFAAFNYELLIWWK